MHKTAVLGVETQGEVPGMTTFSVSLIHSLAKNYLIFLLPFFGFSLQFSLQVSSPTFPLLMSSKAPSMVICFFYSKSLIFSFGGGHSPL